jgi:hypothetical protein
MTSVKYAIYVLSVAIIKFWTQKINILDSKNQNFDPKNQHFDPKILTQKSKICDLFSDGLISRKNAQFRPPK